MNFLGHKSIKNTLIYIQLKEVIFKEENDWFVYKAVRTAEDAKPLIENGSAMSASSTGLSCSGSGSRIKTE